MSPATSNRGRAPDGGVPTSGAVIPADPGIASERADRADRAANISVARCVAARRLLAFEEVLFANPIRVVAAATCTTPHAATAMWKDGSWPSGPP
ncbi:hypothetical protein YM3MPS_54900 [Mycobacterium pseudoshottsii]|nr:hypothetical protein YM3MPS_54900 [Mycobacterium pseudoshottsii]